MDECGSALFLRARRDPFTIECQPDPALVQPICDVLAALTFPCAVYCRFCVTSRIFFYLHCALNVVLAGRIQPTPFGR